MKIIIYKPNTNEWNKFINSLDYNGIERDKAIEDYIVKIGQEISAKEFINNSYLYTSWASKLRYKFIGEPCNPLEKIIKFVYSGSNYINMKSKFPEDFIESRTDWEDIVNYADEMASFIKEIMEDMVNIQLLNIGEVPISVDTLKYLKACQTSLYTYHNVAGLCPVCKKAMLLDGLICPHCGYDNSSSVEE